MRLMSFSLTWDALMDGSMDVTRRIGWSNLKPGERFQSIKKGMGLKKGEHVVRGPVLMCVSNTREPLNHIVFHREDECTREGFPAFMTAHQFVKMFCEHMKCKPDKIVNRIEFRIVL